MRNLSLARRGRLTLIALIAAIVPPLTAARASTPPPPAPEPRAMNAAEISLALEKLNVLGRVLYVAAHPDDENTALISYLANGRLLDTAYISLTRGDGGQNLIGPELRDELGVIRTQELLAARRIDGGQQFFTRANDFGFSKSSDETLRLWDREKILADVTWVIRRFRPDVVITRFSPEDHETHGHHTASAILTAEAFRAAADPARFPEQLPLAGGVWQAKRLVWNTSPFFFQARNQPFDKTGLVSLEAGGYQPLLGKSYPEIAAASRSMHKSQGFGVGNDRGKRTEYFKLLDGEPMTGAGGLFEGTDLTWARVPGGAGLAAKLQEVIQAYDPRNPPASVPALLEVRRTLERLPENPGGWTAEKLTDLDGIIAACLGLHVEVVSDKPTVQPGESLTLQVEAINRSPLPVTFSASVAGLHNPQDPPFIAFSPKPLPPDQLVTSKITFNVPPAEPFTQPYWLREPGTVGTYTVSDQTLIGRPESLRPLPVLVSVEVGGESLTFTLSPRFRHVDRVAGEVSEPLVIAPPVFVELPQPVFVFGDREPKTLRVRVVASTAAGWEGQLALEAPAGWTVEPAAVPVALKGAEAEATAIFHVTPPADPGEGKLRAMLVTNTGGRSPAFGRERIRYPHIEPQTLIPPAESKLVRANIHLSAHRVGYLPGAGDTVADNLREIGVDVTILTDADIRAASLARFDAVVLGVRAYNVHEARMTAWSPELLAYARAGGTVVVQYNTTPGPKPEMLPAPLHVSHDRVTDETAAVRFLAPDHPLLNQPNKITDADFLGWVQERGLYFPDSWDAAWTPLLAMHDPDEKPLDGSLLVAHCGNGQFIYTGLSFFRELPAGVPGAYRLFANLLSLGKTPGTPVGITTHARDATAQP